MLSSSGKVVQLPAMAFTANARHSNSTWIAEDTPCITYGLRGVVHCTVKISNKGPDLHSGIDGGAITEPMTDMYVHDTQHDLDNVYIFKDKTPRNIDRRT